MSHTDTHTHLCVRHGQQLQPTAPVANDVIFHDGAVTLGDDAMASVVIDTIAPELHLALGLDLDPTLAVAGDAVVGHTGELTALGHSDAPDSVGVDHVGYNVYIYIEIFSSVQFSSVLSHIRIFATP